LKNLLPVLVTVGFSAVGVLGDYLLKLVSAQRAPLRSGWFYLGFAVSASTAFGRVYVMRHLKLAAIGVVYAVSMILLLTGVGAIAFREALNAYEVAGIAPAVAALVLHMRFAKRDGVVGGTPPAASGPPTRAESRPGIRPYSREEPR
jgi:drug/metabolite transporter (DMT)-like permease